MAGGEGKPLERRSRSAQEGRAPAGKRRPRLRASPRPRGAAPPAGGAEASERCWGNSAGGKRANASIPGGAGRAGELTSPGTEHPHQEPKGTEKQLVGGWAGGARVASTQAGRGGYSQGDLMGVEGRGPDERDVP